MECFKQLRRLNLAFSTLINYLLYPLYWDLSSFCAAIYLKYFFLSLKYSPLICSFLPPVSLLCLSSLFFTITFLLTSVSIAFFLFVYCFQGPVIWETEGRAAGCWCVPSGVIQMNILLMKMKRLFSFTHVSLFLLAHEAQRFELSLSCLLNL